LYCSRSINRRPRLLVLTLSPKGLVYSAIWKQRLANHTTSVLLSPYPATSRDRYRHCLQSFFQSHFVIRSHIVIRTLILSRSHHTHIPAAAEVIGLFHLHLANSHDQPTFLPYICGRQRVYQTENAGYVSLVSVSNPSRRAVDRMDNAAARQRAPLSPSAFHQPDINERFYRHFREEATGMSAIPFPDLSSDSD
jgi:hypothetical protein